MPAAPVAVRPSRVGTYEVGRTLGEGRFAKVKLAKHLETGEVVAIKIIDKDLVGKAHKLVRRELSTMKLLKHPHVIGLYEVLASKKNVYLVLEYVDGGELFDRIVEAGKLKEPEARKYFQQLIYGVGYCHSRGVYHRDLKPENLLLDSKGNLKISDFGLSVLAQQQWEDGLFHTVCGTPHYAAPEVMDGKGYEGAPVDMWSCGIILYVLLQGALPFKDSNLGSLYEKIHDPSYLQFPLNFPPGPQDLIRRLLDPNPKTRYSIQDILKHEWFQHDDKLTAVQCDDCWMDFDDDKLSVEGQKHWNYGGSEDVVHDRRPVPMNAFEIISRFSPGLDLSGLFVEKEGAGRCETKFTSLYPAEEIVAKIETFAHSLGFLVRKRDYKMKIHRDRVPGRNGCLSVAAEVWEVAPSLFMVEMHKTNGDTFEYGNFHQQLSAGLKDIVWKSEEELRVW